MSRINVFGGLIILLAFLSIFSSGHIPLVRAATTAPTGSYFDHVVVIVMESEGIDNICGSHPPPCGGANTPYMSGLANNYTLGLQYTSISCSGCPTSQPNYVALLSGSNQGCSSGGCPSPITAPNLVDRFESTGLTWKGYFENQIINGQPFQGCDSNSNSEPYNPIHNPFIVFQDITTNTARCNNLVDANPSSCGVTDCALVNDLNSASAPNFMWLTPNDCDNMHGASVCPSNCNFINNGQSATCMQDGDKYLKSLVPNILKSNTFTTTRSALFVTFDEGLTWCPQTGSSSEDCIYSVWAGPVAKNGSHPTTLYNHYSFTKTIEVNWNLPSLASGDGSANAMTEFFNTQPDFTVAANPSSVTFNSGGSSSFTTTVSPVNSFTGTVTLTTSTSPSTGLGVGCNPTTISGGSGSSTCILNSSTPGSYTVTVTGTSGSLSHSATVSVTVTKPSTPDFSMSANPTSLTITQGSFGTSTISLASLNSFSDTITLSALVSPPGPSASLNPSTVTLAANGGGSSTLNVTTGNAAIGSYSVNVTGTGTSISHSVKVNVSVNPPADFTISASPNSLTLGQGSSSTMTPVTVTTSGDRTWFESSYLADSFFARGLIWMFFEDSSLTCENQAGCLLYTTSPTGSSWATPINVNVHVTDSDFSVYTDGTNVYYARYNETVFQATCGRNVQFRTGSLVGTSATVNWQPEQTALKAGSAFTYENEEIIVDSNGQAWIALLSNSRGACGGDGMELPQVIHSSGTNYASWTAPTTLSAAHSNNWHVALASLGAGQIYAAYWLVNSDLHGKLYNGSNWGADEQISSTTTQNDVNAWLFNSGTNLYAIYFDNAPETFNFASRSSTGTWTTNLIGVGESRTGKSFSSSYYSFPDAASYDPTHNQFYLFWMNTTNQRIDEWTGSGSSWTKTTKIISTGAVPYPDSITSFITSSPTNSFPTTGGIFYVSGSSAPFTYNFAALPLGPSSTGMFTVTVTGENGFTGTVSLTTSINPSTGLSATCSPTSIPGGTGSSTCTVNSSTSGNYNVTVTGTSGTISHSTSVYVSVAQSASPDFTISTSPTSVTVGASFSGASSVTVAPLNGFTGTVTLVLSTNSTNLVCTLSSTSITGGSGTSSLSCHGSPAGNYLATVTGTSGSLSHSATVIYHVQDFAVAATPTSVSVTTGTAGTSTISVSPLNGFTGTITLAAASNSTSMSCILSPTSIVGASGTSNLSCSANIPGTYLATVTGSSGGLSHFVTVTYHVTAAPDFSISANPSSVNVNVGATGNSTITVSPLNGFTGTVTLAVATNSTNLSCNLSSTTISGGLGTSTLSCTGSAPRNYLATVTGTSGSLSHLATVTYHAQDFSISANPTSVNISVGVAGTSTITVAPLNGFAGTVALAVTTNSSNLVCVLSSSGITGGSGTSTLSCNGSLPGNYLATVTGTNSSLTHSTSVTYRISALPTQDFTISASPTILTVDINSNGNSTITVTPENGFSGTVTLSVTTNSTNLVCILSPTTITGGSGNSTLSCQGSSTGNYLASVKGTSNSLTHTASVKYQIQDFAIAANPANVSSSIGVAGTSTILVTGLNGFSRAVTLSTSVTPSTGLSISCNPSSIPGGSGSSTCTFNSSTAGNYSVTVTGTSGSLFHSVSLTVTITAPSLTISTTLSSTSIQVGQSVTDSATLQGATATAGGTVSYLDYGLANCASSGAAPTIVSVVTVTNGVVPNSRPVMFNFTGSFSFQARYSGDANNAAATSPCEPLTVNPAPPNLRTILSAVTIPTGGSDTDSAFLTTSCADPACTSEVVANGTVTYSVFANGSCAGAGNAVSIVTVTNNGRHNLVPNSRAVIFNSTGSYAFNAAYSGDANGNSPVTSACEPLTVNKSTPTVTTSLSSTKITTGGSVTDSAILTSAFQAGGTATYNLFPTGDCSGTSTVVSTVTVTNGAVPNSASRTFNTAGNFSWNAVYSGDTNNNGATSSCEPLVVSPSTTTPPSYALVVSYEGFVYKLYPNGTLALIGQPVTSQLRAVSWKPDGSYALIVGDHAVLIRYDGTSLTTIPTGIATTVNFISIAWRPDGSYALIGGSGGILLKYDGTTASQIPSSFAVSFRAISWNPSGTQAILVSYFGQVFQYQSTGQLTKLNSGASQSFDAVAWSPDGSYALIAGDGGGILKYNGTTFQALNTAGLYSSTLTVRFISFSPTGNLALLVGDSGLVLTYNGSSLSALPTLTSNALYSVSWAAGTAYIVGGAGTILTYSGGTLKNVPTGTFSGFRGIAWKPN